jgi:hypothetical protein
MQKPNRLKYNTMAIIDFMNDFLREIKMAINLIAIIAMSALSFTYHLIVCSSLEAKNRLTLMLDGGTILCASIKPNDSKNNRATIIFFAVMIMDYQGGRRLVVLFPHLPRLPELPLLPELVLDLCCNFSFLFGF